MGGVVSTLKLLIGFCISLRSSIAPVVKRIQSDPGRPCNNPTRSFWLSKPHPHVSQHQSTELPSEVDVVIIGSGITGIAVAKTLLEPLGGNTQDVPLRVAMLEAREACSGATGRNGGHIKESAYMEYESLRKKYGKQIAMEIIRFRLAHLDALMAVAEAEGEEVMNESQIRRCETVDVCFEKEVWEGAKKQLQVFLEDFEDQRGLWVAHEMEESRELYPFPTALGTITSPAGSLFPYRLLTPILSRLLHTHPTFTLDTLTPALSITAPTPTHPAHYLVSTPRGNILTRHIVHATNAHAAHLLPGLTGTLFPIRGHMTAQRSLTPLGDRNRSYSFIWSEGFDYMTQVPCEQGGGETIVMLGGGLFQSGDNGFGEVGVPHDDQMSVLASAHLGGVLGVVTGRQYVVEDRWTGVMGFTKDSLAWVGAVPEGIAGRGRPEDGREWVAAGFNGEGMVNAWLSGVAVGEMVCGGVGGVPEVMGVSEERVRRGDLVELAREYLG